MLPESTLWHADFTDENLLTQNSNISVTLVTCFFGFQYAFYSKAAASNAIKFVSSCLVTGGTFVLIIPNPEHVVEYQNRFVGINPAYVVGNPVTFTTPYVFTADELSWEVIYSFNRN
jgi:hypothetical protein